MDSESLESLVYYRDKVLKNIDIEVIDTLRDDRDALISEVSQKISELVSTSGGFCPAV